MIRRFLVTMIMASMVPARISSGYIAEQREAKREEFIKEHHLEKVFLSCYLPTGNCTADGTVPYEGICSCNVEHLGMDCIMYDLRTLEPVEYWECRDIGGNILLRQGKAIDVFRTDYNGCLELKAKYGDYVYIEWVERGK